MNIQDLSKDARSMLLYAETCVVDHSDAAIKSMFGVGSTLFLAWVWVWARAFRAEQGEQGGKQ